ncbi:MAG: mucoidy inhibitor MuiA family protein [Bacteroidetes bacterium]|nr:MAG: mucoidy inhibitor MuiA family protein [Bacteroidota bacterium]
MKSILLTLAATLVTSLASFAQTSASSKISNVTVYRSGALIERTADIALTRGKQVVLFTDLPPTLDQSSLKLEVPHGVRMMKMEFRYPTPDERGFPEFSQVGARIAAMQDQLDEQRDLKLSLQEDLSFISVNSDRGQAVSIGDIQQSDAYYAKRRREIRASLRACINKIEELEEATQELQAQLGLMEAELENPKPLLEVELSCSAGAGKRFTLKYFSTQARWDPFYNVRASGENQPMEFEFNGSIQQNTGEDWENVNLMLSTGNPSLGATEPDLPKWHISFTHSYVPAEPYRVSPANISKRGSFVGLVQNNETGEPMSNARVELRLSNRVHIGISDEDGKVLIEDLPVGSYGVSCQYTGYNTLTTSINITDRPVLNRLKLTTNGASRMVSYQPVSIPTGRMHERDVAEVASLAPGVSGYEDVSYTSISARGARSSANEVFIDGVKVRGAANLPNLVGQENVRANFTRIQQAVSAVYIIDKPFSVPTTGEPQDVWISSSDINAEYIHRLRPARSSRSFLISKIADWESLNLLKGPAHFFVDEVYNGTAVLNPEVTADTMELALGGDDEIVVDRERMDANKSKHFFSKEIDETFHYRIKVRNTKDVAITMVLQEQFPISQEDDVEVSEQIAEGASVDPITGIITWEQTLEPNEELTLEYSFIVTYPRGTGVNLPQ